MINPRKGFLMGLTKNSTHLLIHLANSTSNHNNNNKFNIINNNRPIFIIIIVVVAMAITVAYRMRLKSEKYCREGV